VESRAVCREGFASLGAVESPRTVGRCSPLNSKDVSSSSSCESPCDARNVSRTVQGARENPSPSHRHHPAEGNANASISGSSKNVSVVHGEHFRPHKSRQGKSRLSLGSNVKYATAAATEKRISRGEFRRYGELTW